MTDDLKARGVAKWPHRIWAFGSRYTRNRTLGAAFAGREYVFATPAALSDHPTVKALVAEAEARGMERAADFRDTVADEIGARPLSSIHSALCEFAKRIRAEAALTRIARLGQEWDAATSTEYERKVAQMKKDFPNGI